MNIPKCINYIFGLDTVFCNKPFSYFHYMNILSAKVINPTYSINLYYLHKPDSYYFSILSNICNLIPLYDIPLHIQTKKFQFTEHICDLMRLELIYQNGGIYLDVDTICIRPFDDLLNYQCVMGLEVGRHKDQLYEKTIGLCNAVLMGISKNKFMELWIEQFHSDYRPEWNYNCVQMPYNLSKEYPDIIHIEPKTSFFKYSWDENGKTNLFDTNSDISDCYSLHLWESKNYNFLKLYDDDYIHRHNDTISYLYKSL